MLTPAAAEAAAAQGAPVPTLVSEDGEVAYLYFVLNFGADGWNAIPDAADEIRDIAKIDGGEVHLAGYGGQAADSAEAFEGIDTNLIFATLARGHRDPALHLPQPGAVAAADPVRRGRPTPSRPGWSTSSPSTPGSPSTGRARRS